MTIFNAAAVATCCPFFIRLHILTMMVNVVAVAVNSLTNTEIYTGENKYRLK